MRDVVFVGPGNRGSDGHCDRLRTKNEVVDLYFRGCCGGLVTRGDAWRSRDQQYDRNDHRSCETCNPDTVPFHCSVSDYFDFLSRSHCLGTGSLAVHATLKLTTTTGSAAAS